MQGARPRLRGLYRSTLCWKRLLAFFRGTGPRTVISSGHYLPSLSRSYRLESLPSCMYAKQQYGMRVHAVRP